MKCDYLCNGIDKPEIVERARTEEEYAYPDQGSQPKQCQQASTDEPAGQEPPTRQARNSREHYFSCSPRVHRQHLTEDERRHSPAGLSVMNRVRSVPFRRPTLID